MLTTFPSAHLQVLNYTNQIPNFVTILVETFSKIPLPQFNCHILANRAFLEFQYEARKYWWFWHTIFVTFRIFWYTWGKYWLTFNSAGWLAWLLSSLFCLTPVNVIFEGKYVLRSATRMDRFTESIVAIPIKLVNHVQK